MRILIITDPITPPSYAPRIMATFRYLQDAGHDCILEAGEIEKTTLFGKIFHLTDRRFGHRLYKQYTRDCFDMILCSTYYYFPLWSTRYLSQKWHIPYVVDLRDIVEQWGTSTYFITPLPKILGLEKYLAKIYEQWNIRFRNHVLDKAKAVVSVSPWHCACIRRQTSTPVHLIYNGYDPDELHATAESTDLFHISYLGRIIDLKLRQPQLLLQALSELVKAQSIDAELVHLDFYSEPAMQSAVEQLAAQYGVQHLLHWLPYFDRNQLNAVIARSSILVALACPPSNGQHGILGTKIFEAIGAEKPLLLVPSDEDSLAALIEETGIGLAAQNAEQIKTYILEKYHEWQTKGYTRLTISNKNQFNRNHLAHEFEDLLRHSTHL